MKYAVEMGFGAMVYVPSFIKIESGIQMLIGGTHRHTDTNFQSFEIRKVGKKIKEVKSL
jgi:hypothetical protein